MVISIITTFIFTVGITLDVLAYEREIRSLSSKMAESIVKSGKKTIAVVDFVDLQGNVTELGRFLAEEFSVALAATEKGFEVVDRTHLKSILSEHKLSSTGIIDPATARKLGQIAGVGALVTGSITPFGDSVRLSVKVLDTATARVFGASSGDIAKTKAIEELLNRGIESTSAAAGTSGSTRESSGISVRLPLAGKGIESGGFIFNPVKCVRKGDTLTCSISYVNKRDDEVRVAIRSRQSFPHQGNYSASYLTDNYGNQYPVDVQIGNKVSGKYQSDGFVEEIFLSQTPVNVNFISTDVKQDATQATVVILIWSLIK